MYLCVYHMYLFVLYGIYVCVWHVYVICVCVSMCSCICGMREKYREANCLRGNRDRQRETKTETALSTKKERASYLVAHLRKKCG